MMTTVVDFPVKPEARPYIDAFSSVTAEPEWLARFRKQNLSRFAELGFPNRRSENWRYLDLQPLEKKPLLPAAASNLILGMRVKELKLDDDGPQFVLINGRLAKHFSRLDLPSGVRLGSTAQAINEQPELLRNAVVETGNDHPFAALNAAFFADGFVLDIAPGIALDHPIHIIHLASGEGGASLHTRSLINLGAGSRVTVLETYAGDERYWRNDFAAWHVAEGAALTRIALVEEAGDGVHLGEVAATLGAESKLDGFVLLLGGGTVRHEANITIAGDHAECRLDGAFLVSGREEANIVTTVDHSAVGGTTSELIKGVAAGRAHGAFQGKIIVREGAQQTDAKQTSRNLILGRRAAIDTKPELEILADDVKCAHGASVGDLDEAALFYLRTRGIPTDEARRLLVEGFLREPIEAIADPTLREHLLHRLSLRLGRLEEWS
jgi:Fe-S cluster assembly protein SufD